jgi:uncharacterized protein (DUF302 family)
MKARVADLTSLARSDEMSATPHAMTRLAIPTGMRFAEFRRRFEAAAPAFDAPGVRDLIARGGGWRDIEAAAERNAPHGLMIYATIDIGQLMTAAGHAVRCVEYLLGNHVTAERMFRHDPAVALYAPLRVVIHSDPGDHAIITFDQPSSVFAGLGNPQITVVGTELDHTVAELLRAITGRAPQALLQPAYPRRTS